MYTTSLEELKIQYINELFNAFDGNATKQQIEQIKTPEKIIQLRTFCETLGMNDITVEGKRPKFLPDGKLFGKAGLMLNELFVRLEEKNKELGACSRWLRGLGFDSNVHHPPPPCHTLTKD